MLLAVLKTGDHFRSFFVQKSPPAPIPQANNSLQKIAPLQRKPLFFSKPEKASPATGKR